MHNWKCVNLSKMAGFNISLSLNERQSSSDKKHNKSLRLVLFIPFRCCFAGSLPFSLSTVKQTKLFHSISEMFFTFLARTSLVECVRSGAASCNKRREFWRETHTPLWLLIGRIIFLSREKKHRFCGSDWEYHFLFFLFLFHLWKTSFAPDWLQLICVWKFTS